MRYDLDPNSMQYGLNHLEYLFRLQSSRRFPADIKAEWFAKHPPANTEEAIRRCVGIAFRQALRRGGAEPKDHTDIYARRLRNIMVSYIMSEYKEASFDIDRILKHEIVVKCADGAEWPLWQGFGIFFHNVCWQALYHALKAKLYTVCMYNNIDPRRAQNDVIADAFLRDNETIYLTIEIIDPDPQTGVVCRVTNLSVKGSYQNLASGSSDLRFYDRVTKKMLQDVSQDGTCYFNADIQWEATNDDQVTTMISMHNYDVLTPSAAGR